MASRLLNRIGSRREDSKIQKGHQYIKNPKDEYNRTFRNKQQAEVKQLSLNMVDPSSCIVQIGKYKVRTLVDSGAQVSVIKEAFLYRMLKNCKIIRIQENLHSVTGQKLEVLGQTMINLKLGGINVRHMFHVVKDLNRNMILGRDFLLKNGVRLLFDLHKLKFQDVYVDLEEDMHVSTLVRVKTTMNLKPQTVNLIQAKMKNKSVLFGWTNS